MIRFNGPEETQPGPAPAAAPIFTLSIHQQSQHEAGLSEDFLDFLKFFCQVLIKILLSGFLFIRFPRTEK